MENPEHRSQVQETFVSKESGSITWYRSIYSPARVLHSVMMVLMMIY